MSWITVALLFLMLVWSSIDDWLLDTFTSREEAQRVNIFEQQSSIGLARWKLQVLGAVALAALMATTLFHVRQASLMIVLMLVVGVLLFSGGAYWLWRNFLRLFVGYGYRPEFAIAWILLVGLLGGSFYQQAAEQGVFAPKDKAPTWCGPDWTMCPDPTFHPFLFAFDTMLSVVHLGVAEVWKLNSKPFDLRLPFVPVKVPVKPPFVQRVVWAQTVFGWLAGGVLVALVSGLLKRK